MNKKPITALVTFLLAATCVLAQPAVPAQYFGIHLVKGQPWPTVSFGSLRLWDTDTRWQQMNPASGVYDFSTLDVYLALAHAHAVPEVVLVLGGTPNWISSDPANAVCDYASTATGSCAPPADLNSDGTGTDQAWRSFIYQLATHTRLNVETYSRVSAYEMWNEFSRNTESWTGTHAQMVRMAQDAYCILKGSGTITATSERCVAQDFHVAAVGIVPLAVVVSPSAQAFGPDLNTLGDYFSTPGAAAAADIIATHNYTYGHGCCASAEVLRAQWSALRAALPAIASELPVWSTEGSWGDTALQEPDLDMQSAYVVRAYLLGWSLGYRRMYWYAWGNSWGRLWSQSGVNGCSDGGSGTGCTSPAAKAYAGVYSWMVGNVMIRPCTVAGSTYACQLTRPDGTTTLAVWDAGMSCVSGFCGRSVYPVPSGYSSYLDLANVRHSFRGRTIWIGAKPVLLLSSPHANRASAHPGIDSRHDATSVTGSSQSLLSSKVGNKGRSPR
jgi:hypothetical protein